MPQHKHVHRHEGYQGARNLHAVYPLSGTYHEHESDAGGIPHDHDFDEHGERWHPNPHGHTRAETRAGGQPKFANNFRVDPVTGSKLPGIDGDFNRDGEIDDDVLVGRLHQIGEIEPDPSLVPLIDATNLTEAELREMESLLREKRQVILEGPPGSGKTFVAEKFARYFTDNPLEGDHDDRLEIVQFHQSYGYEDFVQGIRPETNPDTHNIEYRVRDGIFKTFCALADSNSEKNFVVIIDEINRGNISRIFGELLLLLEYRDKRVHLPYEGDFRIPQNVYIIGTMNTTDRSLAQIDYALRRRFYFYRMMPVKDGSAPVLEKWLSKNAVEPAKRERVLKLFLALNRKVQEQLDEHFQVGHSYFMAALTGGDPTLTRTWDRAIMPLLEEYFYNRSQRTELLAEFGIDRLLCPDVAPSKPVRGVTDVLVAGMVEEADGDDSPL